MGDVSIVSVTLFENCVSFSQHLLSVLLQKSRENPQYSAQVSLPLPRRLAAWNYRPTFTIPRLVIYGLGQFGQSPAPQFICAEFDLRFSSIHDCVSDFLSSDQDFNKFCIFQLEPTHAWYHTFFIFSGIKRVPKFYIYISS